MNTELLIAQQTISMVSIGSVVAIAAIVLMGLMLIVSEE